MPLDPTSNIGKLRLRVADYSDLPLLPDAVYQSTLDDTDSNLPRSAKILASYLLGMLAHKTHRKLAALEVWGAEAFKNYKEFLLLTISDPTFMDCSPIPYAASAEFSPIIDFQKNWNQGFYSGTEAQQLAATADNSPNDNSRRGTY